MKVGVVVLNYHGAANTQRCLESLGRLDPKGCRVQVVVVDNSETGHDFEFFEQQYKEAEFLHEATPGPLQKSLTFIKAPANRGYSGGNNIGLYISDTLLAGLDEVLIFHGVGSGRLARAVREFLKEHPRVRAFHDAPPNMGGMGATVVEL